jgi:hypothetical protein
MENTGHPPDTPDSLHDERRDARDIINAYAPWRVRSKQFNPEPDKRSGFKSPSHDNLKEKSGTPLACTLKPSLPAAPTASSTVPALDFKIDRPVIRPSVSASRIEPLHVLCPSPHDI